MQIKAGCNGFATWKNKERPRKLTLLRHCAVAERLERADDLAPHRLLVILAARCRRCC